MEIKMIECPNGHYYNAAMHTSCPQCGSSGAGNFPKTMPPAAAAPSEPLGKTMPVDGRDASLSGPAAPFSVRTMPGGNLAKEDQLEPVVGWLVCINSPLRGVDFRIHDGYNYIGREEGDIHIHGDNQISRQKHAVISFYAKHQTFHIGPADGRNIIELNGEPVFSPVEMKSFDVITVGSTQLMLVALCGDRFSWTDGISNE